MLYIDMVINVTVKVVSSGSVKVSWNGLNFPEITGYVVYYTQTQGGKNESVNVNGAANNSIVIDGLVSNMEYQFQVAVVAELDGMTTISERSPLNKILVVYTTQG